MLNNGTTKVVLKYSLKQTLITLKIKIYKNINRSVNNYIEYAYRTFLKHMKLKYI